MKAIGVPQETSSHEQRWKSHSTEWEQGGEGASTTHYCLWAGKSSPPTEMLICYNVTGLKFEQAECKQNRPHVHD